MEVFLKDSNVFDETETIGVVWVTNEAEKLGYFNGNSEWSNLGQGEPETGYLEGGSTRINTFQIEESDNRYGPVSGMEELRITIADYYNRLYRKESASKFSYKNISICMGGRLALNRVFSILGTIRLGYKIPEYPAYKEIFKNHSSKIKPICIPTLPINNFTIPCDEFEEEITNYQLDAFLMSNPCNPTGHVIKEKELESYLKISRKRKFPLIIDEVYSHFIYENKQPANQSVSAATFIDDVNADQVIIVDALTKSFRYPGWRLAWIVAPENIIEDIDSASSGLDGGPSNPIQRAAIQLFEPKNVDLEMTALRSVFSKKQNLAIKTLEEVGIICSKDANSTFYIWGDISQLPYPINRSDTFFQEALKRKVIVVPGYLFDIRPNLKISKTKFNNFIRFSFGPEEKNLNMGLTKIVELIQSFQ